MLSLTVFTIFSFRMVLTGETLTPTPTALKPKIVDKTKLIFFCPLFVISKIIKLP